MIDILWNGVHWVALLPGSRLANQDLEMLKASIVSHGYHPGEVRY